jgi:membrane-bound lytic murein transglycosylase D
MHTRIALPLVLLLASACAQLPEASQPGGVEQPQAAAAAEKVSPGFTASVAAPAAAAVRAVPQPPKTASAPVSSADSVDSSQASPSLPAPVAVASVATQPRPARPPFFAKAFRNDRPAPQTPAVAPATAPTTGAAPASAVLAAAAPGSTDAEAEAASKSLWTRITRGFSMAPLENDLVHEWENWYSNRPDYVARMVDRSSHFLFHIVEQVEKRGMPMEIALLPMVESAYNPVAYSRSHAVGIWQFISSTGKDYGLRQNWWYDGRRDVIAATDAALDYLEKLHGMFGDWQLALASYNWGEGAVSRAVERNRAKGLPTNYESLTMPPETRGYIPKLMAVKNIILNPARYGLQIADIPNEPYFETVKLKRHIDLALAAKFADMPLDEFKFLNPGHSKPVIRAGESERIVLPKHKVAAFMASVEHTDKPLVSWEAVTLKAGEKAERVAAQHGMTLAELKQLNGLQHQKRLVVGQPLLVPIKEPVAEPKLPDIPSNPVPLQKAMQAAKAASVRTAMPVKTSAHRAAQKGAVHKPAAAKASVVQKGRKPVAAPQLRAENGKRVKVVAAKPSAAKKMPAAPQSRVRVAVAK